jgi:hypothetical protein
MSATLTIDGLVIRVLFTRLLGARVHVFDGDNELVISPLPVRVVQGHASEAVRKAALRWVRLHQHEILLLGQKSGAAR